MDNPHRQDPAPLPNLDLPIIRDQTRLRFPPSDDAPDDSDCTDRLIRRTHPLADQAPTTTALPPEQGQAPWSRISWPWASSENRTERRRHGGWLEPAAVASPPSPAPEAPEPAPSDPTPS